MPYPLISELSFGTNFNFLAHRPWPTAIGRNTGKPPVFRVGDAGKSVFPNFFSDSVKEVVYSFVLLYLFGFQHYTEIFFPKIWNETRHYDWLQRKDLDDHNDCCILYMKHRITHLEVAETRGFTNIPDENEIQAMKRWTLWTVD